jgi:hypothetical protein
VHLQWNSKCSNNFGFGGFEDGHRTDQLIPGVDTDEGRHWVESARKYGQRWVYNLRLRLVTNYLYVGVTYYRRKVAAVESAHSAAVEHGATKIIHR